MSGALHELLCTETEVSLSSCGGPVHRCMEGNDKGGTGGSSWRDIQYLRRKRLLIGDGLEGERRVGVDLSETRNDCCSTWGSQEAPVTTVQLSSSSCFS